MRCIVSPALVFQRRFTNSERVQPCGESPGQHEKNPVNPEHPVNPVLL